MSTWLFRKSLNRRRVRRSALAVAFIGLATCTGDTADIAAPSSMRARLLVSGACPTSPIPDDTSCLSSTRAALSIAPSTTANLEGGIKIAFINDDGSGSLAQSLVERVVAAEGIGTVTHLTIQQVLDGALDEGDYNVVFNARHAGGPNGTLEDIGDDRYVRVPTAFREALDRAHAAGVGLITEWEGGSPVWTSIGTQRKYHQVTEPNGDLWKWYQGTIDRGDCGWMAEGCVPVTFSTVDGSHPVMQGVDASFTIPNVEFCYRIDDADASLSVVATITENGGTVRPAILTGTRGRGRVVLWTCDWGDNQAAAVSDANVDKWVANSIRWAAVPAEQEGENTETIGAEGGTVAVEEDANDDGNSSPVVGIEIPPGTFSENVEVTVQVVDVTPEQPCHDFLIQQTGKCVEITAESAPGVPATLNNNVVVGVCLPADAHIEIYKWDNRQGRATPLKQVPALFLNCSDAEFASAQPSNWFEGLAMGLSRRVGRLVSPKLLYAADRGFGGEVLKDDGLSTFTWAAPVQLLRSGLAVNFFNSGKDAFGVEGTFPLVGKDDDPFIGEAGFDPTSSDVAANLVTVAYGDHVETIPNTSWRFERRTKRWTYISANPAGVNYMDIDPVTGEFRVAGRTATKTGDALPSNRPFTIQIGHRIRGHFLECGENGLCTGAHQ